MMLLSNLTQAAIDDFDIILDRSADFGSAAAAKTLQRFLSAFQDIAQGLGLGHTREDLGFADDILFQSLRPLPFMIIYDRQTRIVLRIVYGRRDYRSLILGETEGPP